MRNHAIIYCCINTCCTPPLLVTATTAHAHTPAMLTTTAHLSVPACHNILPAHRMRDTSFTFFFYILVYIYQYIWQLIVATVDVTTRGVCLALALCALSYHMFSSATFTDRGAAELITTSCLLAAQICCTLRRATFSSIQFDCAECVFEQMNRACESGNMCAWSSTRVASRNEA